MKLSDLLAALNEDDLERLAHEHARAENLSRHQLLDTISGVLRSYRFLHEFIANRQPPTFAMLRLLLDAPGYAIPTAGFRDAVLAETSRLCALVDSGEILQRDDQLRLYRRVMYEARRNDLQIDASESAILGVLRQELNISQVEHYLLEHHANLREFWQAENAFMRELHALRSAGLVFVYEGQTMVAEDVGSVIRQVLGIEMPTESARRLYAQLGVQDLYEALAAHGAPTSGSKAERVERLITNMIQPRSVLRLKAVTLEELKDICRRTGAQVSGSRDEVIDRVIQHFASGRDVTVEPEPEEIVRETRALDEARFKVLFGYLKGHELANILRTFELRHSGTKPLRIQTLWDSHRSEDSLLSALLARDLDEILDRLDLSRSGSKAERIARFVESVRRLDDAAVSSAADAEAATMSVEETSEASRDTEGGGAGVSDSEAASPEGTE